MNSHQIWRNLITSKSITIKYKVAHKLYSSIESTKLVSTSTYSEMSVADAPTACIVLIRWRLYDWRLRAWRLYSVNIIINTHHIKWTELQLLSYQWVTMTINAVAGCRSNGVRPSVMKETPRSNPTVSSAIYSFGPGLHSLNTVHRITNSLIPSTGSLHMYLGLFLFELKLTHSSSSEFMWLHVSYCSALAICSPCDVLTFVSLSASSDDLIQLTELVPVAT